MGLFDSIIDNNTGRNYNREYPKRVVFEKDSQAYSTQDYDKKVSRTEDETLIKTISANSWVYSAIYKIASSVASAPFRIFDEKIGGGFNDITDDPSFRVFKFPNKWFTRFDFWEATTFYLESVGKAFWELVRDGDGNVVEIYPLKPSLMKPVKDKKKFIIGWLFEPPLGKSIAFNTDEIVFLRYFDPDNPYDGLSPLEAASKATAIDIYAQEYSSQFFSGSARPDGLLIYESELTDEDYDRIRRNWDKAHKGVSNAHRLAIVEQGMDYKQMAFTQKDMEFINQRKYSRDEILACFGVPPACVGVFESAIKANAEVQERMFWTETMIPKLIKMAEAIRLAIIPILISNEQGAKFDIEKITTAFDTSSVHILSQVIAEREDRINEHVKNGIISRNEARTILNSIYNDVIHLEDFEGGDKIILPQNVNNEIGVVPEEKEEEISDITITKAEFNKQESFDADTPELFRLLENKPMLIKMSEENNKIVRNIILTGLAGGKAIDAIQLDIWERFNSDEEFSIARANRIARTESTQIANASTLESYKQSGVVEKKQWLTSRDAKVRPVGNRDKGNHQILEGQVRELNEPFSNGAQYPGDQSAAPEEVINCRCTMLSVLKPNTGNLSQLFKTSDNEIVRIMVWKQFDENALAVESEIRNMFLQIFEDIGNRYINKLNKIQLTRDTIDFIMLSDFDVANGIQKRYNPLKKALYKEFGNMKLRELVGG